MKTVFNGIMKNKWTKLAALAIAALWSGPTVQAQAPHPERIYLSGTGIDNTKTWEFFCSGGQNSGKWKKIEVPCNWELQGFGAVSYTHLRAHETGRNLVCRLLLEKKNMLEKKKTKTDDRLKKDRDTQT